MLGKTEIDAVESRAAAARLTMAALCELAGVHGSSWSRAKTRGRCRISLIKRMEQALDAVEAKA